VDLAGGYARWFAPTRLLRRDGEVPRGERPGRGVAEEGVRAREICEAVAAGLRIPATSLRPEEVGTFFVSVGAGFVAMFIGMAIIASSALTRARLNWDPTGPGLIDDLKAMDYAGLPEAGTA